MQTSINTYIKCASPTCFGTSEDVTLVLKYVADATLLFVLIKTVHLVGVLNGVGYFDVQMNGMGNFKIAVNSVITISLWCRGKQNPSL